MKNWRRLTPLIPRTSQVAGAVAPPHRLSKTMNLFRLIRNVWTTVLNVGRRFSNRSGATTTADAVKPHVILTIVYQPTGVVTTSLGYRSQNTIDVARLNYHTIARGMIGVIHGQTWVIAHQHQHRTRITLLNKTDLVVRNGDLRIRKQTGQM